MKKIYETPELDIEKFQFFATLDDHEGYDYGDGTEFLLSGDDPENPRPDPFSDWDD